MLSPLMSVILLQSLYIPCKNMVKENKKINYVAKLTRVMDEGERRYSDKINHKEYAKTSMYGKGTNRLNELAVILDMLVNSLAAGRDCLKGRTIVKIAFELLRLKGIVQKETRERMKVVDENGKEIKI